MIRQFTLSLIGSRVQTLITQRVGALEQEIARETAAEEEDRRQAHAGRVVPMRRLDQRDSSALRAQAASLATLHGLVDPATTYDLTLADLAQLDLIDVAVRYRAM